ncbi:SDR family NAD(P)-dependent oxidoreductase [Glycomyces xiaoerkulensis]|uniref:SDR family NAD(P)-dependent oxidoreductase n=1 Tax=Glycomyces xiaoerkulensis TaxID=2038139 RepID=UPI000C2560D1|nr:SDR family NAD(P)-dependent oxidoreductase [Glycomyces xiaoerkulensis]
MTTQQRKLDSGFGHDTTAADVLDGRDLSGTHAVVTGGYSGLGLETTKALTNAGASVLVPARRPEVARAALDGLARVEIDELDLSDLDSVRSFADRVLETGRHIDVLINDAGVMACPETRVGPGWELQFATNHLGHYALVNHLWPLLSGGARVVALSSGGHRITPIRWDDVHFEAGYDRWAAYGQSKTANVLFAVELDRLARDRNVRAFALDPGGILTPLQRHLTLEEQQEMGWIDEHGDQLAEWLKTREQGAATQTWAATSPMLEGAGGIYLEECDVAEISEDDGPGVRPYAIDPGQARRLWNYSADLTGVDAFA